MSNNTTNKFLLFNVSEDFEKILSWLNINKAVGMDQISAKFLKKAACPKLHMLAYPLSRIINVSANVSVFPEECKIAKSIHYQLQDYLKENGLLCKYQ